MATCLAGGSPDLVIRTVGFKTKPANQFAGWSMQQKIRYDGASADGSRCAELASHPGSA